MNKILIITGPTATGKTALGVSLAQKFNGEIVSADSRQVYKFMDIGTGKDVGKNEKLKIKNEELGNMNKLFTYGTYEINSVPVWGLDIVVPDYRFNVSDWVTYANSVIANIQSRDKLPIIVGGTGQYIYSLLNPPQTLGIEVNTELRKRFEKLTVEQLQEELMGINRNKWELMNESDRRNPRRLVRAIETTTENEKLKNINEEINGKLSFDELIIGLTADRTIINERIDRRVEQRIKDGMVEEVKRLVEKGYSFDLPSMSGIGYREFKDVDWEAGIDGDKLEQIAERWKTKEHQYAKKQMGYIKKYLPETVWFDVSKVEFKEEVENYVLNNLNP